VRFRLPPSAGLAGRVGEPAAGSAVLASCVVEAAEGDERRPPQELPPFLREELSTRMAALDPQADLLLALECPACGHGWQADLDVGAFVLAEIDAHAARLLGEVHGLARAYGWSAADILALRPARRRRHLQLASAGRTPSIALWHALSCPPRCARAGRAGSSRVRGRILRPHVVRRRERTWQTTRRRRRSRPPPPRGDSPPIPDAAARCLEGRSL